MKDVCIVGGGVAGLYLALLLRRAGIHDIVVLEAEKFVGGRVRTARFAGTDVVLGAGIGRAAKDAALGRLMSGSGQKKLYSPFRVRYAWAPTIRTRFPSAESIVRGSKTLARRPHAPFGEILRDSLGSESRYRAFLDASLYTNFEADDATDVIRDYGMDDNEEGWTAWRIDWKRLIRLMRDRVGRSRLVTGYRVLRLERRRQDDSWTVAGRGRPVAGLSESQIHCRCVVVAADIRTIRALLPRSSLFRGIRGQPFVRVYATFDRASAEIMASAVKTLTIVPSPLKKIIPIDSKRGLYMIGYSDNDDARALRRVMHDRAALARMVGNALGLESTRLRILRLRSHYWPVGTHAYLPLSPAYSSRTDFIRRAQRPGPGSNVFVVGEAVSRQQGWVEGALRSVDAVFPDVLKRVVTGRPSSCGASASNSRGSRPRR